ncbi:protein translocase subunit SecF [Planosporangium thailandense]|uniref:Protein-export membrane protein SecF n=1 Tax=Planosporangium thailandense TaxID=765197 RepID=A0ABX0Y2Y0_9ACTN|nr:protein translocase subunit SecF [Planosporangium thailandense]NJC72726.1 protein translocase subunit SecF [Planosporangium thailandense]
MNTLRRLYRGETNIDFIGHRKRWYIASAIIVLVCLASLIFRGFNFGIEFAGGSQFQVPAQPGVSLQDVRAAVENQGVTVVSAQTAGSGSAQKYVIRTPEFKDSGKQAAVKDAVAKADHVSADKVDTSEVSSSWGSAVTDKALLALVVFLVVVGAYIWIRFEQKMAIAGLAALAHDLLLTAGIYSVVGFEVTPGTVVGLLTILGFSLYDSVVVFDKVDENARGLLGSSRYTYAEVANQAVNQTLMRSINTSLIGLLPVAGLLFVGAGMLGVGTLKDLALVLFVGMLTGAYSSLFLATPWLVDLKLLDKRYKLHTQRVLARRAAGKSAEGGTEAKAGRAGSANAGESGADAETRVDPVAASTAPRVGAKPAGARAAGAKPAGGKQGQSRKRSGGGGKRR